MIIERRVVTGAPAEDVFGYVSDFTTTTEWDPATVSTVRVPGGTGGTGAVGTEYRTVSRFRGRTTELGYVVTALVPGRQIVLRGENRTVVVEDTIRVTALAGGGSELTYRAQFTFRGFARLAAPLLAPALRRLGDDAQDGLRRALACLG